MKCFSGFEADVFPPIMNSPEYWIARLRGQ